MTKRSNYVANKIVKKPPEGSSKEIQEKYEQKVKEILENSGTTWIFEGSFNAGESLISAYDKRRGGFKVETNDDGTLSCFAAGEAANIITRFSGALTPKPTTTPPPIV